MEDDDFPPREPPRFWIAVSIFVATLTLIVFMLVYTTVRAEAQERCPPLESMISELGTKYQEVIVWQGVAPSPRGPIEVMLFQSQKGTWTILQVVGISACIMGAGQDATPLETGRGV